MADLTEFQAEDDESNSTDGQFHRDDEEVSLNCFIVSSKYDNFSISRQ